MSLPDPGVDQVGQARRLVLGLRASTHTYCSGRLTEVIAEGEYYGMQTFDQALMHHVLAGRIDFETAYDVASSPHDFKLMLDAKGQRSSGIDQALAEPKPSLKPEHAEAGVSSYYGP